MAAEPADLLDPILDAREVVETFVHAGRELEGWEDTLRTSAARLAELGEAGPSQAATEIADQLGRLISTGLGSDRALVEALSRRVESAMVQITIPGLPGPHDEDWSF